MKKPLQTDLLYPREKSDLFTKTIAPRLQEIIEFYEKDKRSYKLHFIEEKMMIYIVDFLKQDRFLCTMDNRCKFQTDKNK